MEMLSYIHKSLKSRLSGWFARLLSQGGKEVLLKAVAMVMPIHAMSCFRLSKTTCDSLTSAMSDFWWSSVENHRKVHWISWERMCLSKQNGGLGFRDIEVFNHALLAKQAWRVLQDPHSLLSQFLKSQYFPHSDLLSTDLTPRPSFAWRRLLFGRQLLVKGLFQMVGNGESTRVWTDQWIRDGIMRTPLIENSLIDIDLLVSDLIDFDNRDWNRANSKNFSSLTIFNKFLHLNQWCQKKITGFGVTTRVESTL